MEFHTPQYAIHRPQSPRGFSALARLYYLVRPTKTAMPTQATFVMVSPSGFTLGVSVHIGLLMICIWRLNRVPIQFCAASSLNYDPKRPCYAGKEDSVHFSCK